MTLDVLKCDTSKFVISLRLENIERILVTLDVSKLDTSKLVNLLVVDW